MLSLKPKSKSPQKAEITYNVVNNVDVGRLLNTKQHCDRTKDDLKKIYRLNRNEKKIKFLSYDFHQLANFQKTYNKNNINNSSCNSNNDSNKISRNDYNSEASVGFSSGNINNNGTESNKNNFNNCIVIRESYKIKTEEEKRKTNFNGFDKLISKYSAKITSEDAGNYFNNKSSEGSNANGNSINSRNQNTNKIFQTPVNNNNGQVFDNDPEKYFDHSKHFNLSYTRLSKTDRNVNKTKHLFDEMLNNDKHYNEKTNKEG